MENGCPFVVKYGETHPPRWGLILLTVIYVSIIIAFILKIVSW